MREKNGFDVIIVGGSYAGLSAAMALGRSLRDVLIIDSGLPCNRQTPHSHNFITQDGETPAAIAAKAKAQVLKYDTVRFTRGVAVSGRKLENGFAIVLESGEEYRCAKLIFASGIKDEMPGIKGFADCWGISVVHCPYCHGYEYRGQKTAILANGDRAFHLASLVSNLTGDITILTSGKAPDFTPAQTVKLETHNIAVIHTQVIEIVHEKGVVKAVAFNNGSHIDFDAVYAAIPFTQHSSIPAWLGCELTEQGHLKADAMQKTTVDGVFACGDCTTPMRSVASSVATGNLAGAAVNMTLTQERF